MMHNVHPMTPHRAKATLDGSPIRALLDRRLPSKFDYCIFRRWDQLEQALNGTGDIDLLIGKEDANRFASAANALGGKRAEMLRWHDNAVPGREDWLFHDLERNALVHLDVHNSINAGPRFAKLCPALTLDDLTAYRTINSPAGQVSVADPTDLIKISAVRSAFSGASGNGTPAVTRIGPSVGHEHEHEVEICGTVIRTSDDGKNLYAKSDHLHQLASSVGNGRRTLWLRHFARMGIYGVIRAGHRLGLRHWPKRRMKAGGLVVALVGPDGMGKSTQVEILTDLFGRKLSTASIYMGSSGLLSRIALSLRSQSAQQSKVDGQQKHSKTEKAKPKDHVEDFARSVWGLYLALLRLWRTHHARLMARRGLIVICDRWPQSSERGILDGPVRRKTASSWPVTEWIFQLEERVYRMLDKRRPDVLFHLVANYEIAETRKPGELSQSNFDSRVALMEKERERFPDIVVIDAAQSLEANSRAIAAQVWARL